MNLKKINSQDELIDERWYLVFTEHWCLVQYLHGILGIASDNTIFIKTKVEWCDVVYEVPEKP